MATRKSPARGTTRRPAKATTATGRTRSRAAAKKPLEATAKDAVAEPQNNVVPHPATEAAAAPEAIVEPAPVVEDAPAAATAVEAPAAVDEPTPAETVTETVAEEPEVEAEPVEEPEVEMTFKPSPFPGASLFAGFPEFPSYGAADMQAFTASGAALVEGMQNLGVEMMAFSRKAAERNVETTMKMLSATSVEEVMDLQSRHAMGSMDHLMTGGAKLTGMAIELASKAASPFTRC